MHKTGTTTTKGNEIANGSTTEEVSETEEQKYEEYLKTHPGSLMLLLLWN